MIIDNSINYRRRIKQAEENSMIIVDIFHNDILKEKGIIDEEYYIESIGKLQYKIKKYVDRAEHIAKRIEANWAIPILVDSISRFYYGDLKQYKAYGPIYKRALAHIWQSNHDSQYGPGKKNIDSIVSLLELCYVIETINGFAAFFILYEDFKFTVKNGYISYESKFDTAVETFAMQIAGRGKRLRIADVNSEIIRKPEYIIALLDVLDGKSPNNIEIFKGTFYEFIPGVDCENCLEFWQTLYFRTTLYYTAIMNEEVNNNNIVLFPEIEIPVKEGHLTQEIVTNSFWRKEWIKKQDITRYSNLIVERPILRITDLGDYVTSSALIGDSINLYIDNSIMCYSDTLDKCKLPQTVFKNAISEPFEDEVIEELVNCGFEAGHVSEAGIWHKKIYTNNKVVEKEDDLRFERKTSLYGEVDAFAVCGEFAFLIECKVLHDYRSIKSIKNIVCKLEGDSESFRHKIKDKAKWLEKAYMEKYNKKLSIIKVLLTDISLPSSFGINDSNNDDIIVTNKQFLFDFINENKELVCGSSY